MINLGRPETAKRALWAIMALALAARIYLCFFTHLPHTEVDSYGYLSQADTLLQGGYTDYFPNGYPIIIALIKLVTGAQYLIPALLWLNILMSLATLWFVFDIAHRLSNKYTYGVLAAAILAFFPTQINYVRWVYSEMPAGFFLVGAFFFYYRKQWIAAGLFFGIATMIRNNIQPIFLILFVIHIIHGKRIPWALIIATAIPLIALGSYCKIKTGKFSTAGNSRINILFAASADGTDVDFTMGDKHPEAQTTGQAMKVYLDSAKDHPVRFIKQRADNLWVYWGFYSTEANGGRGLGARLLLGLGNLYLIVFGLWGWWRQRKYYPVSIMIIPFVILTVLHSMLVALPRYTYPVEPFLILLSVWAVLPLTGRDPDGRWRLR